MTAVVASGMHKVLVDGEFFELTDEGLAVFIKVLLDKEAAAEEASLLRRELADLKVEVKALHEKVAYLEGENEPPVAMTPPRCRCPRGCCGHGSSPLLDRSASDKDAAARGLLSPDAKALLMPFRRRSCGDCE